ncbi:MAG: hypothetical protein AAGB22_09760 [Bacteroidota bacterium]
MAFPGFRFSLLLLAGTLLLSTGCSRIGCTDPAALNYDESNDQQDCSCRYTSNQLKGRYFIDQANLGQEELPAGFTATFAVNHAPCQGPDHTVTNPNTMQFRNTGPIGGALLLIRLDGKRFAFPANATWDGQPFSGSGDLSGNALRFDGVVHTPLGDVPLILRGKRLS